MTRPALTSSPATPPLIERPLTMTVHPPIPAAGPDAEAAAVLADALRRAADLPGVLMRRDVELGPAAQLTESRCTHVPIVHLGAELAAGPLAPLTGTLAHELAHQALGHLRTRPLVVWWACHQLTLMAGVLALALRSPWCLVLFAACVAARIIWARISRTQEYQADAYAVRLLDRTGLPGLDITTSTLWAGQHHDTWWYRTVGWMTGTHPTAAARVRHLHRGRQ
ncbi:M48 family metalloprotease [Sphaerisporangium sp. NPDC005288]|uniref:M48 family metalloprotease n=1 Tax=Sphaerisporangium sp. NPDC005288 TaxID=3155114 RepID=UPI00339F325B